MPPGRNIERPERAEFKPIPPDLDIVDLIQCTPNFEHVTRIDARNINSNTMPDVEAYIHDHVIQKGLPLVIENWHLRPDWSSWIFNVGWLSQNHGQDRISVRDLKNQADIPMSFGHYLSNLRKLATKFHPHNFDGQGKQQRLYGKDLDCPPIWRQTLSDLLPQSTFYLDPTADLMSSLPEHARAENMMCYVGHEGTYTPAHKEMCASLGQNIMVATSEREENPANRAGAAGTEGSSIWFMMGRDDREVIAEYWLAQLGHDIEVEKHFASVEDLANAPFTVYVVEQKLGDYILVPPLAPHQVWNRGEFTIKAAWNRTTVDSLEYALTEALPKARLVCRDEQYKNRAIIYQTLCKYSRALESDNDVNSPGYIKGLSRERLANDFLRLFNLFNTILLDQCFDAPGKERERTKVDKIDNEYIVTCSYCRSNIWNRFLSCEKCVVTADDGEEDCYDVCIDCYARGRSCGCQSGLKWVEQEDWSELVKKHEEFRSMAIHLEGAVSSASPKKFSDALVALPRKTVARVCFEQNKSRPFVDVTKDPAFESEDDNATTNQKKKNGQLLNCHVCKVRHEKWKSAACSNDGCAKAYCFGNLWRAFDMDPCDDVLVKYHWKCPVCLGICSCGACQKNPKMKPHHPRGTFLGADTKNFVDPRSVEVLVDFRRGNLSWLKPGEVDPMTRLKRKRDDEEDNATTRSDTPGILSTHSWNTNNHEFDGDFAAGDEIAAQGIPIDPALGSSDDGSDTNGHNGHLDHLPVTEKNGNRRKDNNHQSELVNSLPSGGKPGGGQYTLSPKSSSNKNPGQNPQTDPAIGMAGSRLQRGEGSAIRVSISGGDTPQQNQQRLPLPSPSAMLTGALPPVQPSPSSANSHFHPYDSKYDSQHSYPFNMSTADKPHSSINSSEDASNSHTPNNEPQHLSTLERNPIAFIAAAGLMQILHDHSETPHTPSPSTPTPTPQNTYPHENYQSLSEVGASGLGVGTISFSGAGGPSHHVDSSSNSYPSIRASQSYSTSSNSQSTPLSSLYPSLRYTPMTAIPTSRPVPAPLPPSLLGFHGTDGKGKRKRTSTVDHVVGDLPQLNDQDAEREAIKLAWVKRQQKLMKDRKRWKQARKKTKIVVLKIASERLSMVEDEWRTKKAAGPSAIDGGGELELVGGDLDESDDLVTTDLAPVEKPSKKTHKSTTAEPPSGDGTPVKSGRRIAPGWVEISDGDEDDISEVEQDGSGADDGEYRGWAARSFSKKEQAAAKRTKQSSRRISKRDFFGDSQDSRGVVGSRAGNAAETPGGGGGGEGGYQDGDLEDGIFVDDDGTPAPAPPRSESEIRRLAEEEAAAAERLEEEKRAREEREAREREEEAERARKQAEEEAERARKLAEQKAEQEARQRELERERKRKEEIARAYRESKLLAWKAATGEEPAEAWGTGEEEEEEEEELLETSLLPEGMDFAVVIEVMEIRDRDIYEVFPHEKVASQIRDHDDPLDIPDLDINMDTPVRPARPTTTSKRKGPASRRRGPTRRLLAKPSAISKTPSAQSPPTNPPSPIIPAITTTTPTTTTRKPRQRADVDDDGAFRGSRPRPPRPRRSLPEARQDHTNTPKSNRKKPRPSTTGRRRTAAAKSQSARSASTPSSPADAAPPPPPPVRTSSRKRKSLVKSYTFDSGDERDPAAGDDEDGGAGAARVIDLIDLEIDPDVGMLEREKERRAKLKEKEAQRGKSSVTAIASAGSGGEVAGEGEGEVEVKVEEEYNSRWRRKTARW